MKGIKFCSLDTLNITNKKKKIFVRSSVILKYHIGKNFHVHTGNKFTILLVSRAMLGFRFGDFCLTRKSFSHKKKKKKSK